MKKVLLAAVCGMALSSAPAFAADLPETFIDAPVAVPSFSWSGAYVGVFAGWAFADDNVRVRDRDGYQTALPRTFGYDFDDDFTGGVTLGVNVQLDNSPLVFGLEGELGYLGLEGSRADPAAPAGFRDGGSKAEFDDFYATLNGRVGVAFDRFLVFGKAGIAYVDTSASYRDRCSNPPTIACGPLLVNASGDGDEFHFTAGGGVEYAITDEISIKAEYTYIATGQTINTRGAVSDAIGPIGISSRFSTEVPDLHIVKAGLNYRFNW